MTERRRFIATASGAMAAAAAAAIVDAPNVIAQPKVQWRMSTTFTAVFDIHQGAAQGKIEAFMGSPQYWTDREPALEWFATIPFGMNCEGMAAWYYQGDGLKLWEEAYAAFNLVPRPALWDAPQMAGWFRKK